MKRQLLLNTLFFLTLFLLLGLSSLFAQANTPLFIRLRSVTFDPLSTSSHPAPSLEQVSDSEQQLAYLVQFTGPVREEWKATLTQLGVTLYDYIPDYTFLARMKSTTVSQIKTLPFVRWVGIYQATYRLAPELTSPNLQATTVITVWVQTFPDLDLAKIRAQIVAWGGKVEGTSTNALAGYLQVVLPSSHLADLAALEGVIWVEPFFPPKLNNDIGGGEIMRGQEVQQSLGLSGAGQVIGIADTGLDTGNLETLHPDLRGRVNKTYCLGRTSPCDWSDPVGHGTHVTGSVLGNGSVSKAYNATGPSYAGLAPQASLVFQSISDSMGSLLGGIPFDRGNLLRTAYQDGVRIHSNSWGGATGSDGSYGGYNLQCQQIDLALWENKDLLTLFSAGNNGLDVDKDGEVDLDGIGSPGTAKNVVTVGASETNRPTFSVIWGSNYGEPIASDKEADNPSGLAAFSSRGPADDGRIKPDVVSPGTYIASLHSRKYTFNDTFEGALGDTSGTYNQVPLLGGTQLWQRLTNEAHSGSYSWQQSVKGTFNAKATTVLLTPPMNLKPIGSTPYLSFWQKYTLTGDNRLAIVFTDQTGAKRYIDLLPLLFSEETYIHYFHGIDVSALTELGLDLTNLRIGFALRSESGNYDSTWWLDDLRVKGGNWGTLSNFGLAQPGDTLDEAYAFNGGTSMATPLTAGGAALLREWLTTKVKISNPSAALLKGFLIQGAEDIYPGQYVGKQEVPATRPNNASGWGRVNLAKSMNLSQPQQTWFADNNTGLATGLTKEYNLVVGNTTTGTGGALRATLIWTDYPASPLATKTLVNDLDLELIAPDGTSYQGNGGIYTTGQCLRDGKWDTCNNVEGIILPQASNGSYKLIVRAVNVANGNLQPFALVISGDYLRQAASSSLPSDNLIPISTPTSLPTTTPIPTSTPTPTATSTSTSTPTPTATSTPTPEPLLVESSSPTLLGFVTFLSATVNSALPYSYIQWDFGDNSAIQSGSNLLQITHLYTATKRFYPKATLFTSNGSLIKAATTQVDVIPLTLMGNGPTLLGNPTTFTVTLGKGFTTYQQIQWDFGDGKTPLLTRGLTSTYTYTLPKTYLVTATVIVPFDQRGIYVYDNLAAKTIKTEITSPKLSLISTNLPSATVILTATLNDFALPTADLTFDLGDQTTQKVILTQDMKSASIQHTYAKEGNYTVLATLSSPSYGEKLAEDELQVSVNDPLPKVFLPLVLRVATTSSTPSPTASPTSVSIAPEAQALTQANIYRQLVNAPLLSLQTNITQAAKDHATYYTTNYKSTAAFPEGNVHGEVEGFTGFTGVNFWDRMKNAGYAGSARFEVMHFIADPLLTVESWVASVYHRIPFIDPRMNEVGYGQSEVSAAAAAVMDFGASTTIAPVVTSTVILYPVPNQTAVPRAWDCNEAPNPYADVSCSSSNPVGYVITILPMGNQTFDQLELTTAAGTLVTTHPLRYNSDYKVWYAAATAPLNASTSYNVKLQGKDNAGKALTLKWSFTTGTKLFQTNSKATLLALPGR